jgi:hypothetical protein
LYLDEGESPRQMTAVQPFQTSGIEKPMTGHGGELPLTLESPPCPSLGIGTAESGAFKNGLRSILSC